MIIRQRTTIIDSFLLKVVFPYLESGHHESLMRLASVWRSDITKSFSAERKPASDALGVVPAYHWLQPSFRALTRWFQPQHSLAPIAVANRRTARRRRSFEEKV
jgi:hypothetical protein